MPFFLSRGAVLRRLETPAVYVPAKDELYELDEESISFLMKCRSEEGCAAEEDEFVRYCLSENILSESRVCSSRPPLLQSPVPSLRYLELQITDICNLRCRHCYIGPGHARELGVERVKKVLREFDEMQGLRLLVSGGEPLMHSRFVTINEMLPDYSFRKVLLTNGLLLTSQIIRQLNFDEVQISIDGIGRSHEMVRGEGSFRSAMDAINLCIESGIDLSVSTMIHRGNLADFDEMEQLFRGMGIKDWTVDVPCAAGRLRANRDLQLEPEEGGGYLRYGFGEGLHAGAAGFACGLHLMSVSAAGKASKCSFYSEDGVGTVEEGLRECWGRIVPLRLEELRCDCDHLEACRGGCRYRAEVLGDPLGKDLYRCALYDIIDQEKRRENFSERRCVE